MKILSKFFLFTIVISISTLNEVGAAAAAAAGDDFYPEILNPETTPKWMVPVGYYDEDAAYKLSLRYKAEISVENITMEIKPYFPDFFTKRIVDEVASDLASLDMGDIEITTADRSWRLADYKKQFFLIGGYFYKQRTISSAYRKISQKWLHRSALLNNYNAQFLLGILWLEEAVEKSIPSSFYYLSYLYERGIGFEKDAAYARNLRERSLESEFPLALLHEGKAHTLDWYDEMGGSDPNQGLSCLEKAESMGLREATYYRGRFLAIGEGNGPILRQMARLGDLTLEYEGEEEDPSKKVFMIHPETGKREEITEHYNDHIVKEDRTLSLALLRASAADGMWDAAEFIKKAFPKEDTSEYKFFLPGIDIEDLPPSTTNFIDFSTHFTKGWEIEKLEDLLPHVLDKLFYAYSQYKQEKLEEIQRNQERSREDEFLGRIEETIGFLLAEQKKSKERAEVFDQGKAYSQLVSIRTQAKEKEMLKRYKSILDLDATV